MAYRYGNREQITFLPTSIEEYVDRDDPVRVYDVFVDALDKRDLGIVIDEHQVGNSEYDPVSMLKLLVYGYSYGIRSSRKLERALYHNLSFIWLLGGLKPDHKTISNFRREYRDALKGVLKQCARMCLNLGLVEGNTLFVDGTLLRANASLGAVWTEERCKKALVGVDKRIEEILSECDAADEMESGEGSSVHMTESLANEEVLRERIEEVLNKLDKAEKKSVNTTDPDSFRTKSSRGYHMGYNGQIAVDGKNGLIVSTDVVNTPVDGQQLFRQCEQASESIGKVSPVVVADAGYHNIEEMKKLEEKQKEGDSIKIVVPNARQVSEKARHRYAREGFIYDAAAECYRCPEGHVMQLGQVEKERKRKRYWIDDNGETCTMCKRFGNCTRSLKGRRLNRHFNQELVEKWELQYNASKETYRLRKEKVELPFGHIKQNMNFKSFLLRGLAGVRAELALVANSFNLTRMINLLGVQTLVAILAVK